MKNNIEKQKQDESRLHEKKRKLQEQKEKKKQQDSKILSQQKQEKERQRAEFFAKMKRGSTGQQPSSGASNSTAMTETQGGVTFELVGVPKCMDEPMPKQVPVAERLDDVMVFDMSAKAAKPKQRPAPKRFQAQKEESKGVEIMISDKDRSKVEKRHIDQTRAELDHYRHLIDKALGSDETLKD